ncbi:hypothetical protein [Bifidobacterium reuteri]|uniref:hypothetical protein n=1 Tax=Bifidobacterium reuteri TaxID=983706 RepID=UPI00168B9C12|nr:hypothetical protein [Bifidobacterium reuteri]
MSDAPSYSGSIQWFNIRFIMVAAAAPASRFDGMFGYSPLYTLPYGTMRSQPSA